MRRKTLTQSVQVLTSSWDGQPFAHNRHRPKIGELCPFWERGAGSTCNTMRPGPWPTLLPSGISIHSAVWPQQTWAENWGLCPLFEGGELGPHLGQCCLGRGLLPYQVASWSIMLFRHNRHGPKIGVGLCSLIGEGRAGSPSNTMSLGSRSTSLPSGILIHPAIWPQQIQAENWGLCPFGEWNWVHI